MRSLPIIRGNFRHAGEVLGPERAMAGILVGRDGACGTGGRPALLRAMNVKLFFALAALVGLVGCESIGDATSAVRERIAARDEGKVRIYAAAPRVVYDAVRTAAADMGYRFLRGGPAQGEFEAVSGVRAGETHGSSRQISMKVKLKPTLDGKGTEIAVRLGEILEADSSNRAGQATETPLRDTPQHEVFFQRIARVLGVPAETERARP